jgi:NodT family efflux transporter outer membrane factor (OMF) lipoprotein
MPACALHHPPARGLSPDAGGRAATAARRVRRSCWRAAIAVAPLLILACCGCTSLPEYIHNGFKVGPNYHKPPAPIAQDWIEAANARLRRGPGDLSQWWKVFHDPVLDDLICAAYKQNLPLREAGFRVLQARAQLGIAIGNLLPQTQQMMGGYLREATSAATANRNVTSTIKRFFPQWDYGFTLAWELDFWGRFRRAIESARDSLDASVEDYDDVLVILLGEVATAYVQMRTLEKRIKYANDNVAIQRWAYEIAKAKRGKLTTGMDVDQAKSILKQTEAGIPELEIALRQSTNQLCILLGIPMEELRARLGPGDIPRAPPEVVVGIPADLLRRRPDVRRAERQAAAQSAQIGVAESLLYPHFFLRGTLDYQAAHFKDLFNAKALSGNIGPTFQWDILNYGRLLNNVRLQDARFQELVAAYQQSVLNADKETEDGLVTFLRAHERTRLQRDATEAGLAAVKAIQQLWKDGLLTDYTRVAQLLQNLVLLQDTLAVAEGEIGLGLIQVYRALGGGWQIRLTGCEPSAPAPGTIPGPALGSPQAQPPEVAPPPRRVPPRQKGREGEGEEEAQRPAGSVSLSARVPGGQR